MPAADPHPLVHFEPGRNCWRVERAERLSVIVDAQDYFTTLRAALKRAKRTVYLIGWDFDLRIEMCPGEETDEDGIAADGWPNALGDFLNALTDRNPDLHLHILKWDGAMLAAIGKQVVPTIWMQWFSGSQIHFALDSHHPVGACHHSKIVVIDDEMAFCGGIDVTEDRWDTRDHTPDDPRRTRPDGEPHGPWHDVTTALAGPVARALGDLSRLRWEAATGERLTPPEAGGSPPWPDDFDAGMRGVDVAIARTAPRYHGDPLVNEIEHLYLDAIRGARDTLYLESQYLAAGTLCDALEERLREPDGPEVVVINPREAESFMEDEAMHSVRSVMIDRLREAGNGAGQERFRIFHPVNAAGTPIYVHAKVVIADDRLLRVGSSNIDNRSMGFDTECDVAVVADDDATRRVIRDLRRDLLAEHLGSASEKVGEAEERHGSLIAAIEELNEESGRESERGLRTIHAEPLDPLERALAETRLFDPRYRPKPKQKVEHAVKRGMAPYHVPATLGAGGLLGAVAVGLTAAAGWTLYKRWRDGRDRRKRHARLERHGRFPTPAIVTREGLRR